LQQTWHIDGTELAAVAAASSSTSSTSSLAASGEPYYLPALGSVCRPGEVRVPGPKHQPFDTITTPLAPRPLLTYIFNNYLVTSPPYTYPRRAAHTECIHLYASVLPFFSSGRIFSCSPPKPGAQGRSASRTCRRLGWVTWTTDQGQIQRSSH